MSRRSNSGKLVEIIDGEFKGKKGIVKYREQEAAFNGKLLVNLCDEDFVPLVINGKPGKTLKDPKMLKAIGYFD
jgi:hypothetical protein